MLFSKLITCQYGAQFTKRDEIRGCELSFQFTVIFRAERNPLPVGILFWNPHLHKFMSDRRKSLLESWATTFLPD